MKRVFIIVVLVVVALAFCLQAFAGYRAELRHATSRGGMYDMKTGNAKLLWSATLFTDGYRRAFAEKHVEIKYLNPVEAALYIGEQENEQAREWEVVLAMYTPKAYKKFSLEKDSFWETFLTTDFGEDVQPLSVEEIKITPYWRVMYPFLERWAKLYRITFPKAALGKKAYITMRSVVGDDSLRWKVRSVSE